MSDEPSRPVVSGYECVKGKMVLTDSFNLQANDEDELEDDLDHDELKNVEENDESDSE